MNNYNFENVSIVGRIAYAIMCAEEYLIQKYPNKDWTIVFKDFWEITSLDLWDDWLEKIIEIIPEYLFEFDSYMLSDFDYLSEEKYNELKELYDGTNENVNAILYMLYDLARNSAYSSIKGNGRESLSHLKRIIIFLQTEGVQLPDAKQVQNFSFSEKNGWGNSFDGTILSKVVKSD